jgi:hypothetical protein
VWGGAEINFLAPFFFCLTHIVFTDMAYVSKQTGRVKRMAKKIENMTQEERIAHFENKRRLAVNKKVSSWKVLQPEQRDAITEVVSALQSFDEDYFETYKICDADVPNKLKMALWSLEAAFVRPLQEAGDDDA